MIKEKRLLGFCLPILKAKFVIGVVFMLLGTNGFTYHATREAMITSLRANLRKGHQAILRDEGFAEHERVMISGMDLENQLIKSEIKAEGFPGARWNDTLGSFYVAFMLTTVGILIPFVRWQKREGA